MNAPHRGPSRSSKQWPKSGQCEEKFPFQANFSGLQKWADWPGHAGIKKWAAKQEICRCEKNGKINVQEIDVSILKLCASHTNGHFRAENAIKLLFNTQRGVFVRIGQYLILSNSNKSICPQIGHNYIVRF